MKSGRGPDRGTPPPLIFALATEPLISLIREQYASRELTLGSGTLTISLYTDGISVYVKNPATNLLPLIDEVVQFGQHSGLRINWGKSEIFPLTDIPSPINLGVFLRWRPGGVKYLGIHVTNGVLELCKSNFGVVLEDLRGMVNH